jgi:hypothetical protein
MATQSNATELPSVETVLGEVVANLAMLAHAYLNPPEGAAAEACPNLEAAEIAIDVASRGYDRIQLRLSPDERSAYGRLLTDVRLDYVKKRGP